jgi:hypothetical protein
MGYQGVTDYADSKGWMGGMRNKDLDSGIALPPTIEARYGYQSSTYEWGATVDGSTVEVPHSARLEAPEADDHQLSRHETEHVGRRMVDPCQLEQLVDRQYRTETDRLHNLCPELSPPN